MMVNETNDNNFNNDVSKGLTLTDFWASWCGPCKMQSPIIEELAQDPNLKGKVKFNKINVDDNPKVAQEYGIMSIPTLLITKDGKEIDKIIGLHSKQQLEEALSKYENA